ncbi:MAG: hypothetical protein KAS32_19290 [Candidatus Peribacteraceae bacterium]|nr:hypothetical protein [Candidatus Peribacteraceae bacterium]
MTKDKKSKIVMVKDRRTRADLIQTVVNLTTEKDLLIDQIVELKKELSLHPTLQFMSLSWREAIDQVKHGRDELLDLYKKTSETQRLMAIALSKDK